MNKLTKTDVLLIIVMILLGYILFLSNGISGSMRETKKMITFYDDKIKGLQTSIDSLHKVNTNLDKEINNLTKSLSLIDGDIEKVRKRINDLNKVANEKKDIVNTFGVYELEKFFADRYGDSTYKHPNR